MPQALARVIEADTELAKRWRALPVRRLAPGETLLAIGESPSHVWWIGRGLVRFYFLTADGQERNKSFHAEGAWIGSGMPPYAAPSPYAIEALEATELRALSYEALGQVLERFPAVQAVHVEALGWTFSEQVAREAELLFEEPAARYERFLRERPALASRLPLHHIASHLGITNVALSRIRRRLGLIRP